MTTRWSAPLAAALLWTSLQGALQAQTPGPAPSQPADAAETPFGSLANRIDFGARVGTASGDEARWQRYRDLRDGPVINRFDFRQTRNDWSVAITGDHVGYRDQRYRAAVDRPGRVSATVLWDQIPLFISADTRTLYRDIGSGMLLIDDAVQRGIQEGTFTIREAAAQAMQIDTRTRRDNAVASVKYRASQDTDLYVSFTTSRRNGSIPYGATFGFSNAIEVALPIDSQTTTVGTMAEWANQDAMLRVGWDGSWYHNDIPALVWDNPLRITDSATAPSQGQMALWPSNTYQMVSTAGSIKLPVRSRLVGNISLGWARQNEPLLPFTINSAIPAPSLPRASAEARGQTAATYLAFTSRPVRRVTLTARHRFYRYDNDTPAFHRAGFVNYDTSLRLEESEPLFYSLSRQTLDLDATTTFGRAAWKIGYGLQAGDRTARHWEETTEHMFRTSLDVTGQGPYSVRGLYEHSVRDGDQLDLLPLEEAGEQITMRHYDIAARDRDRASIILTAMPMAMLDLTGSIAVGKEDYTDEGLGLRDNSHRIYSVGFELTPGAILATGATYSFERYDALLNQRQATALDQAFDPTRRWDLDTDDRAHTLLAHLELPQVLPRTDVRLSYDYSHARTVFVYSLPAGSTLPLPEQLPPVKYTEHRTELEVLRGLTAHWSLGFDYWFNNYDVEDFALGGSIDQGLAFPPVEPGQTTPVTTVLLNYLYRPFTGHTAILRAIYAF